MSGFDVNELLDDFLVEAGELLEELDEQLIELEKAPDDGELLNAVFRAFHTVKGGAGFLELAPLVAVCHRAEEVFDAVRHGDIALDTTGMDAALEALDTVTAMMDEVRNGGAPTPAPEALLERLETIAAGTRDAGCATAESVAESGQPAPDPADAAFDALLAGAAPGAEASAGTDEAIGEDEFEALLDELHGAGNAPGTDSDAAPEPEPEPEPKAVAAAEPSPAEPVAASRPARSAPAKKAAPHDTTIRVDTRRLDNLINLAGELVLARNRLIRLRPEGGDTELDKAVGTLDLLTNDMQNAVMGMRMQPVRKLFSRFPKMTRELARSLDKVIELELAGEETELDKSLVDALADPLVHLLRNAIDHGIEAPAARVAAGKPETGNVRLSAAQQGEQIIITIADDGGGMDAEALRKKAVEKNLLTADAAARLAPEECHELIFSPGFSTRAQVSEVSGRGVGMDVVKNRIAELNGRIEIDSTPGAGSTFRVCVPLTLAILPTLMVRVLDRIYALPVANIGEVYELDREAIRVLDRREVIMTRGHALPLVFLDRWACQGAPRPAPAPEEHVVVIQTGSQRVALVVDAVLGREEVVIKPLGALLESLPGLAGATITGDGRIALILDCATLFSEPLARPRAVEA